MRSRRIVMALALIGAAMFVAPGARAQSVLEVQVGTGLLAEDVPGQGMRFYMPPLRVHQGDTVTFNFASFHTATLLPANTDVSSWAEANTAGVDKPWGLILSDPDEEEPSTKVSSKVLFPNLDSCGGPDEAPCSYDGTGVVNSGTFDPEAELSSSEPPRFSSSIDAPAGTRAWLICLIHPNMRSYIDVVEATESVTTQHVIDVYKHDKVKEDRESAATMHEALGKRKFSHRTASGKLVKDVFVGFDGRNYSLAEMYPRNVSVKKGGTVRFHFDQIVHESHTASLPLKPAMNAAVNSFFPPYCDSDGDGSSGEEPVGNLDGTWGEICPGGPDETEFDNHPDLVPKRGNGIYSGGKNDLESSGDKGLDTSRFGPFDIVMKAPVGSRTKFVCMIHPFMRGKIVVK